MHLMVNDGEVLVGALIVRMRESVLMIMPSCSQRRTSACRTGACAVGNGKQLAGVFPFEFYAQRCEPFDSGIGVESGEHISDDVSRAVEIFRLHHVMCHVALFATGHQYFVPERACRVEYDNSLTGTSGLRGNTARSIPPLRRR